MEQNSFLSKNIYYLNQKVQSGIHDLKLIFFELTHKCNISCLHCGSDCIQDSTIPDMKQSVVLDVLQDIKKKYDPHRITVCLSGGEPLCYPDVFNLGSEILKLGFPWGMVTNGYGWTQGAIRLAKQAGLQTITVSLDGLQDNHNWLRGKHDSFKKAVNCISMLVKDPFFKAMDVVTCVNKRNLGQLDEMHDTLVKIGVKQWRLFIISPIGRAADEDLFLNGDEMRQMYDKIIEFKNKDQIEVNYSCSGYLGSDYEQKVRRNRFFCMAGINVAGIMINGDILACPNIDRFFSQGNVHNDSFTDIWENKYEIFRTRSWMKNGMCRKCKEWKLCRGNSFHLRDGETRETRLCHFDKIYS